MFLVRRFSSLFSFQFLPSSLPKWAMKAQAIFSSMKRQSIICDRRPTKVPIPKKIPLKLIAALQFLSIGHLSKEIQVLEKTKVLTNQKEALKQEAVSTYPEYKTMIH